MPPDGSAEQFVLRTWWNVDHERGEGAERFYTADGVFLVPAGSMRGREQIAAAHAARNATVHRTSRHVVTNLLVKSLADDRVRASYVLTINAGNGTPPLDFPGPQAICDAKDELDLEDGEWLIASRELTAIFVAPHNDSVLLRGIP